MYSHLPLQGPSVMPRMGVAPGVPGRGGREARWRKGERPECCCKLCVNRELVILPPTRRRSWLSGLGVDEPLRLGDGSFPTPQAPGLPEGNRAAAAFVLFSFSLFQFYIFFKKSRQLEKPEGLFTAVSLNGGVRHVYLLRTVICLLAPHPCSHGQENNIPLFKHQ